jgi:ABC-2 type transport system permease protein
MQVFLTLTRRELATYFVSLTGYIIIAAVALLCGLSFWTLPQYHGQREAFQMPVTELFFQNPMFWFILLIANAVITMRLYAHEKYSGTYETLMTTPVSDLQVISGQVHGGMVVLYGHVAAVPGLLLSSFSILCPAGRRVGSWRAVGHVSPGLVCLARSSFRSARLLRRSPRIKWWRR